MALDAFAMVSYVAGWFAVRIGLAVTASTLDLDDEIAT